MSNWDCPNCFESCSGPKGLLRHIEDEYLVEKSSNPSKKRKRGQSMPGNQNVNPRTQGKKRFVCPSSGCQHQKQYNSKAHLLRHYFDRTCAPWSLQVVTDICCTKTSLAVKKRTFDAHTAKRGKTTWGFFRDTGRRLAVKKAVQRLRLMLTKSVSWRSSSVKNRRRPSVWTERSEKHQLYHAQRLLDYRRTFQKA